MRWVGRMGNCPPTFWQVRGGRFRPHITTYLPRFRQLPTPLFSEIMRFSDSFCRDQSVTKSSGHCIKIYFCCCKSPLFQFLFHPIMTLRENFLANYPQQIINWQLADIFQNEDAVISSALTLIFILRGALVNRSSFRFFNYLAFKISR